MARRKIVVKRSIRIETELYKKSEKLAEGLGLNFNQYVLRALARETNSLTPSNEENKRLVSQRQRLVKELAALDHQIKDSDLTEFYKDLCDRFTSSQDEPTNESQS